MIRRRVLVPALALPHVAARAQAQAQAQPAQVGFLHPRLSAPVEPLRLAAVREGLAEAARSNRPVEIMARVVADGSAERLRAHARDLAGARLDAIVAVSPSGVDAARDATRTTPIVAVDLETDPVAAGWVASLAKPGGNVSGVFFDVDDFATKCLQILAEAVPRLSRVGVLWDPSTGSHQRAAESSARMGMALDLRPANTLADVGAVVRALAADGVGALLILSSPLFAASTAAIAAMANAARLPAIMLLPDFARPGGLIAYGPDIQDLFRRAGAMARRIVDGARASELPVERPVRFNLILNLRTAKELGLEISPLLLARADEVVE